MPVLFVYEAIGSKRAICSFLVASLIDVVADDFRRGGRYIGGQAEDAEATGPTVVFVLAS
jgi:hypothetical protein